MKQSDFNEFSDAMQAMLSTLSHGKTDASASVVAMWFKVLEPYTLEQVTQGMTAHMRTPSTGRTLPIPADIVAQIEGAAADDGRPGPEEAWSIAQGAADESATIVWTEEMALAWGAAGPLIADRVAARKAFQEVYERELSASRRNRRPVRWVACLGHDERGRAVAIEAAHKLGRITTDGISADLLALPKIQPTALLKGPAPRDSGAKERALKQMQRLRAELMKRSDAVVADTNDRDRTNVLKQAAAQAVAERG